MKAGLEIDEDFWLGIVCYNVGRCRLELYNLQI